MSGYLNFYLIDEDGKYKKLCSYDCATGLYHAFHDNLNVECGRDNGIMELGINDFLKIRGDLVEQAEKARKQIAEYEKHTASNNGLIQAILSLKDTLHDIEATLHDIDFLKNIFIDMTSGYSDFEGMGINIEY